MLNDMCADTYTDKRLFELLITSARLLPLEISFITNYSINVESETISPDPISTTEDGEEFINFMVLKAVCMADVGNFRAAALLNGISARLGPAAIQTGNYGNLLKELLKDGPCGMFKELALKYNLDYTSKGIVKAVMTPFASNDFVPNISYED